MSVFSWFRGKSAAAEEAAVPPLAAEAPADEASEVTDGAAPAGDPAAVAGSAPGEAVEIPRQQSAEDAADSEAGEGTRT
ncbi:hypothetical protein ACWGI0_01315 [Streptomyces sp. NPDC054802]